MCAELSRLTNGTNVFARPGSSSCTHECSEDAEMRVVSARHSGTYRSSSGARLRAMYLRKQSEWRAGAKCNRVNDLFMGINSPSLSGGFKGFILIVRASAEERRRVRGPSIAVLLQPMPSEPVAGGSTPY